MAMKSGLLKDHHHHQYARGDQDRLGNGNDNLSKVTYHFRNDYNVRGTSKR
jgi:hypothetical protein